MTIKCDYSRMLKKLGETYEIMNVYVKFHSACRHIHSAIDAAFAIRKAFPLVPSDIKEVNIKTYSIAINLTGEIYEPKTPQAAKFSLPYSVAVAFLKGKAGPEEFSEDTIKDPKLLELARKVRLEVDPQMNEVCPEKRGATMEVKTKTGSSYKYKIELPRGEPEFPASDEQLKNKFINYTSRLLNYKELILLIDELEKLQHISDLTGLLRAKKLMQKAR